MAVRRAKRSQNARELALAFLGSPRPAELMLERVVALHVGKVIAATDGNLSLAAALLGMHRRTLQRYLRRLKAGARRVDGRRRGARKKPARRKRKR